MKVLHVLETLSPRYGGPVNVVRNQAEAQQRAGHDVTIATTNADHPRGVYCKSGWYPLAGESGRVFQAGVQFMPLRFSLGLAAYLRRAIVEFDIVHIHGIYRFPPTYAAYQARKRGVPYIIRPHGSLDPYLYSRSTVGSLRLKRLYERMFDFPNLRGANAIHYTAEEERERTVPLGLCSPAFVIPNGVNWGLYRALPPRGRLRTRWGIGDAPLILFLGRLHFKKGLDLLIPAMAAVRHHLPDTQLVIIGPENDDYGVEVRRWVAECNLEKAVHFIGPLEGEDVTQAYVDADVFVLPSYTENFGIAVTEAMACALPVVISDQVNIHSDVAEVDAGLVTRCDVEEIASALETVLRNPERRRSMGAAGRRLVQDRHTWPAIVDALTREYEAIVKRHRV